MLGGLFQKGSLGNSVRTIGSTNYKGRSIGGHHSGYVRGIGHGLPHKAGGKQLNEKIEAKVNELQNKFSKTNFDY